MLVRTRTAIPLMSGLESVRSFWKVLIESSSKSEFDSALRSTELR